MRRIELGIRASMTWFHQHRSSFNLVQFAAAEERFAPVVRQNREVAIADAVRHIKDGIVEGRIADQDPGVLAEAVIGVTERLAQAYLATGRAVDGLVDSFFSVANRAATCALCGPKRPSTAMSQPRFFMRACQDRTFS